MMQNNCDYGNSLHERMQIRNRTCTSESNISRMNQEQLMNWINECSFVVYDTLLFLDTHPCDQEALAYFEKYHAMRLEALKEYGRKYSPLTLDSISTSQEQWEWVYGKWPWEGGNC